MKILMFGAGVISTIYGHAFRQSGYEVFHYVKPNKIDELKNGVQLHLLDSRKSNPHIQNYKPLLIDELPSLEEFDLVVVSLRHYQLESVLPLLAEKLGKADILFFNHLWEDTSLIEKYIQKGQYIWGFPNAGGGFYHLPHLTLKGSLMDSIILGEMNGDQSDKLMRLTNIFQQADIKVKVQKNMQHWLWKQFALNAGISSMAVKSGGMDELLSSLPKIRQAVLCIREALDVCKARGVNVKEFPEAKAFYLPSWLAAIAFWGVTMTNKQQREIFKAYNHMDEIQMIYNDIIKTAKELNVPVPKLEGISVEMKKIKLDINEKKVSQTIV
ncbi:ketopantoate reductase family protein [Metabacillus malikii]|uniref:2-dehydropantoate 2-reductase n=1 Tax=Metabacillus malikii TaxID=1504265 RepID=A0ABT9ZAB5_9BACI|nr:2-dehydropantoate 2-reductase N-terminal domain-containing protein [Metabacillus malikii]MDQ0228975.1 2-dehydropantoate 2-reductase [Metabacillus malikii]